MRNIEIDTDIDVPEIGARITALFETQYADGSTAIVAKLRYPDEYVEDHKVSVNLGDDGKEALNRWEEGAFFVKTWSDGAPVAKALFEAGVIKKTPYSVRTGYVEAPLCYLA